MIAVLDRLGEQAAHAQELGLTVLQHLLELLARGALVAVQLRGLGAEQQRRSAVLEQLFGPSVVRLGGCDVAGGGRHQTLRQRLVAAVDPRPPPAAPELARRRRIRRRTSNRMTSATPNSSTPSARTATDVSICSPCQISETRPG